MNRLQKILKAVAVTTEHPLPLEGGRGGAVANALNVHSRRRAGARKFVRPGRERLGWGWQTKHELTLPLTPSRRGRGDNVIKACT
jgi:hypothetical protein